jgi:hypothetical protein
MEWFDNEVPLCNPHLLQNKEFEAIAEILEANQEEDFFGMNWCDPTCYATEILDAKYEKFEVDEVINQCNHLNLKKKEDLLKGAHQTCLMKPWCLSPQSRDKCMFCAFIVVYNV